MRITGVHAKNSVAMTAQKCLYIVAFSAIAAWTSRAWAEGDVTVISSSAAPTPAKAPPATSDGTPVVHKSLHKKKKTAVASGASPASDPASGSASSTSWSATTTASAANPAPVTKVVVSVTPAPAPLPTAPAPPPIVKVNPKPGTPITISPAPATTPLPSPAAVSLPAPIPTNTTAITLADNSVPSVETGLPVGRYAGVGAPIKGVTTFSPSPIVSVGQPHAIYSSLPSSVVPLGATAPALFSNANRSPALLDNFTFTNFPKRYKNVYPWRSNIITTIFWIGEGSTPISSTTNVASAWDLDWRDSNSGSDSPYDRNGYASGNHASTVNPFYVALPFNDLAFPDKAREWLPRGWYRHPRDGKEVSACQDRWVAIKNAEGIVCFAQWEDVGPLGYDDAEYVFGSERPTGLGENHAGLDVSPAVAQYLDISDRHRTTSWRFVDDEDVRPGPWLKLDEQAVIYTALHQLKNKPLTPIQRTSEPIDDSTSQNANKQKVDNSRG